MLASALHPWNSDMGGLPPLLTDLWSELQEFMDNVRSAFVRGKKEGKNRAGKMLHIQCVVLVLWKCVDCIWSIMDIGAW